MLKKFLIATCLLFPLSSFADLENVLVGNIQYDWIDKDELAKEEMIQEVRYMMFSNKLEKRRDLKKLFYDKLKDKNYIENYKAASEGLKEYKDNNISAFFYKKLPYLYMYGLQDKKDLSTAFYYDAIGNLRYVDFIDGYFPDYPYSAIQYRISGKPVSAIYFASKDCQYLFKPNGEFEGVWYKHNLYNTKNKIILTRTTY